MGIQRLQLIPELCVGSQGIIHVHPIILVVVVVVVVVVVQYNHLNPDPWITCQQISRAHQ